jgi:hypothetical protein
MLVIEITPAMKKYGGLSITVLLVVGTLWFLLRRYTAEYRLPAGPEALVMMTPHQQKMRFEIFGKIAAREVSKLVGTKNHVIMIIPYGKFPGLFTGSKNAIKEHFWDEEREAFLKEAPAVGLQVQVVPETLDLNYFAILKKYPDAGAIITHRMPHPDNPDLDKVTGAGPKLVKFGGSDEWTIKYFKRKVCQLNILECEHSSLEPPNFQTDQECFDYYYKVATPETYSSSASSAESRPAP